MKDIYAIFKKVKLNTVCEKEEAPASHLEDA
jgi:hypothetical protein